MYTKYEKRVFDWWIEIGLYIQMQCFYLGIRMQLHFSFVLFWNSNRPKNMIIFKIKWTNIKHPSNWKKRGKVICLHIYNFLTFLIKLLSIFLTRYLKNNNSRDKKENRNIFNQRKSHWVQFFQNQKWFYDVLAYSMVENKLYNLGVAYLPGQMGRRWLRIHSFQSSLSSSELMTSSFCKTKKNKGWIHWRYPCSKQVFKYLQSLTCWKISVHNSVVVKWAS